MKHIQMQSLSEKQYGKKTCIGFFIPIVIMALNTLFYLIWREDVLTVILSIISIGLCFCVVCCIQIQYASFLIAICEAVSTAILVTYDLLTRNSQFYLFPSVAFSLVKLIFFYSMCIFIPAQLIVLVIFSIVRSVIKKHSSKGEF